MVNIGLLPSDDETNGWLRLLPPRTAKAALAGDVRADWLVIGGGYAGLAAARRLGEARPNDKVVLLEAQAIGDGTSGRSSGFAIDVPHNVGEGLEELAGSRRYLRLSRAAIAHLDRAVEQGRIECQWSRRGKYHAAVSPKARQAVLEPYARELGALGEPFRWLDRDELRREIGTSYYCAAVFTPGGRLMNPAALVRGLADTLPANVTLHEHSPVTVMQYENGVRATTDRGSVFAPKMILAVNGHAPQFGFYRGRLIILAAFASLSRRLTAEERQALGGNDDWGVTPANAFAGVTMRLTRDHRLLIRQYFDYEPDFRRDDAKTAWVRRGHQRLLRGRFPMLPAVTMEHTWRGFVCLSGNAAPGFGRVATNVYSCVCQNAVGVTKGTIAGVLAADMAMGEDNPLIADMEGLGTPKALPPRLIRDVGVRAKFAWETWRWRSER